MSKAHPFQMLFLRPALFAVFQCLIAVTFAFMSIPNAWYEAQGWWIISGFMTNIVSFIVMNHYFKEKGLRYSDNFKFVKKDWWKDVLMVIGLMLITIPLSMYPNTMIANLLYDSADVTLHLFFRPLPYWVILLGFIWAVTQGLVELPFYFAYLMPRIEKKLRNGWFAWLLASFFLALQHIALPMIFDWRFIVWRFGMFLLFAFFIGLCLKLRPRLFPYVMIIHALMDMGAVAMLISVK